MKVVKTLLINLDQGVFNDYSFTEVGLGSISVQDTSLLTGDLVVNVKVENEIIFKGLRFWREGQNIMV